MADIFLSYAREDQQRVKPLAEALEALGWSLWWDTRIGAGLHFDKKIEEELAASRCAIAARTERSVASDWVRAEAAEALDQGKLIPVFLDSVKPPLQFRQVQGLDLQGWRGSADNPQLQQLIANVSRLAGSPRDRRETTTVSEPPASKALSGRSPSDNPPSDAVRKSPASKQPRGPQPRTPKVGSFPEEQTPPDAPRQAPTDASSADRAERRSSRARHPAPGPFRSRPLLGALVIGGLGVLVAILLYLVSDTRDSDRTKGTDSEIHSDTTKLQGDSPGVVSKPPRKPLVTFKDCPECPEMVVIPAGSFRMGSPVGEGDSVERPQHEVRIAKPFAIGKTEVTFDQWGACVAAGSCNHDPEDEGWGRGMWPVINISWKDANEYLGWLSKKTGKAYRLPTEAEWEYAARAGTTTPYSTGDCIDTDHANYDGRYDWERCPKTGVFRGQTVEVGTFPANPWGLHGVYGNVWEWVQDCWNQSYQGVPADGDAWESGDCENRVVRGGSWYDDPGYLRSAARRSIEPGWRGMGVGFRVAQDL